MEAGELSNSAKAKRTALIKQATPSSPTATSKPRQVLVARKIRPGETIQLSSGGGSVTMPNPHDPMEALEQVVPLSATFAARGPRLDAEGRVVPHSVLGEVHQYDHTSSTMTRSLGKTSTVSSPQKPSAPISDLLQRNKRMGVSERGRAIADERMLTRWEQQEEDWRRQQRMLAQRTNNPVHALAMSRGPEFREKLMYLQKLEDAVPKQERQGEWETTLRNGATGERYIELGSHGIFCAVPSRKPRTEKLANPIDQQELNRSRRETLQVADPAQSWRRNKSIQAEARRLSKHMQRLNPHDADAENIILVGQSPRATQPPTMAASPEPASTQFEFPASQFIDPLRPAASQTPVPISASSVQLSSDRLFLEGACGSVVTAHIMVANTGTAALQYEWVKLQQQQPTVDTFGLARSAVAAAPSSAASSNGIARVLMREPSGVLAPGLKRTFAFVFRSATPGLYRERWQLRTYPQLDQPAVITIRGLAIQEDTNADERKAIDEHLHRNHALHVAEEIFEEIFAAVKEVPRILTPPQVRADRNREAFERLNADLQVFYTPEVYDMLETVYVAAAASVSGTRPQKWSGAVRDVQSAVDAIEDPDTRTTQKTQLDQALSFAVYRPPQPGASLLNAIATRLLSQLCDSITDTSLKIIVDLNEKDEAAGGAKAKAAGAKGAKPAAKPAAAKPAAAGKPKPGAKPGKGEPDLPPMPELANDELKPAYLEQLHQQVAVDFASMSERFADLVGGEVDIARLRLRSAAVLLSPPMATSDNRRQQDLSSDEE
eukprot:TRINITY_DN8356_c0_g1_i1.p1 TRINITY_DN8356_c0_g1~~TRINITY_DN8356_c0_g1_i1.p1  ORF type:complete len:793 (-),score=161.68 TRINITY_DN8356_c0_g1_i1:165-2495(-)